MAKDKSAPAYKLYVNGNEVPPDVYADVISVEFSDAIDRSDMAIVTLANPRCKYSSGDLFVEGATMRLDFGYVDHYAKLSVGEIVGIEPIFPLQGADVVVIRALDRTHRLRYGTRRRGWKDSTYKAVFEELAKDVGLTGGDFGGKPPEQKFFWIFQKKSKIKPLIT